eukprot:5999669-Pyramimonas_sp.AAC.2
MKYCYICASVHIHIDCAVSGCACPLRCRDREHPPTRPNAQRDATQKNDTLYDNKCSYDHTTQFLFFTIGSNTISTAAPA